MAKQTKSTGAAKAAKTTAKPIAKSGAKTAAKPNSKSAASAHPLDRLFATVKGRKGADPDTSYTARLYQRGRAQIAKKVGEEAVEVAIASLVQDKQALIAESGDLLFHLLVLWADAGVRPEDAWAELERRFGTSGITEKRQRRN